MTDQLTFAAEARDDAIARVFNHAPPDWKAQALAAIRWVAQERREFTTDDLWPLVGQPPEPRAMGAIMVQAARRGWIVATDRTANSRRAECHARPVRVWASRIAS